MSGNATSMQVELLPSCLSSRIRGASKHVTVRCPGVPEHTQLNFLLYFGWTLFASTSISMSTSFPDAGGTPSSILLSRIIPKSPRLVAAVA